MSEEKEEKAKVLPPDLSEMLSLVGIPQREIETLISKLFPPPRKKAEENVAIARIEKPFEAFLLLYLPYVKYWYDDFLDYSITTYEQVSIGRGGRNELIAGVRGVEKPREAEPTKLEASEEEKSKRYRPRFGRKGKEEEGG